MLEKHIFILSEPRGFKGYNVYTRIYTPEIQKYLSKCHIRSRKTLCATLFKLDLDINIESLSNHVFCLNYWIYFLENSVGIKLAGIIHFLDIGCRSRRNCHPT